ncbi:hypothetical protein [Mucilaginibacter sp.]|uniref:hypothetical protein n=1 Tax=Mucilaginibacter sp. TaxID=1882438 RepID=UPI0025E17F78|nr:hypothetical protein [Mucilaginibacter sp.]
MALFSSSLALQNLTKLKGKRAEPPKQNFEYHNFTEYKNAGGTATSLATWKRTDGKWLKSDRESCNQYWKNAVISILKDPVNMQNRLMPFEQVSDFYHYTQILVTYRKHQTQWLFGAYYLVSDLADAYDRGETVEDWRLLIGDLYSELGFRNLQDLLGALNVAIANYAISQFNRLLYGQYRNLPRTGFDAWKFDKQFIFTEQASIAYSVYSNPDYADGLALENAIFNKRGLFAGYDLVVDVAYIPVYTDQYDSNLTDGSNANLHFRYGARARVQIPLGMLYPNQYFYDDDVAQDIDNLDYSYSLKDTVFAKTMKRGHAKAIADANQDRDVTIFLAYLTTTGYLKKVFYE